MEVGISSLVVSIVAQEGPAWLVSGAPAAGGGGIDGAPRPLVPILPEIANGALRNQSDMAALEIHGRMTIAVHGGILGVAIDDHGAGTMVSGSQLTASPAPGRRVAYLAVFGGIEMASASGPGWQVQPRTTLRPGSARGVLTIIPRRAGLEANAPIEVGLAAGEPGGLAPLTAGRFVVANSAIGERTLLTLDPPAGARTALAALGAAQPARGASAVAAGDLVALAEGRLGLIGPDHGPVSSGLRLGTVPDQGGALWARSGGAEIHFSVR
jgi:hypothetical protein